MAAAATKLLINVGAGELVVDRHRVGTSSSRISRDAFLTSVATGAAKAIGNNPVNLNRRKQAQQATTLPAMRRSQMLGKCCMTAPTGLARITPMECAGQGPSCSIFHVELGWQRYGACSSSRRTNRGLFVVTLVTGVIVSLLRDFGDDARGRRLTRGYRHRVTLVIQNVLSR